MSERLSLALILCLTLIGALCLTGMILLELNSKPVLGHLPSITTAVVVALTGLVAVLGQSLRPNMVALQKTADAIQHQTNSGLMDLRAELTVAREEIAQLKQAALAGKDAPPKPPSSGAPAAEF